MEWNMNNVGKFHAQLSYLDIPAVLAIKTTDWLHFKKCDIFCRKCRKFLYVILIDKIFRGFNNKIA